MSRGQDTNSEHHKSGRKRSVRSLKPILLGMLFIFLQIVCYTWVLQRSYSKNTLETAVNRTILRVDTIYESMTDILEDAYFTTIHTSDDMHTEAYATLQNKLSEMQKLKTLRYLYTAKRSPEGVPVYLVDGTDPGAEDFACPGSVIEAEMLPYLEDALSGNVSYSRDIIDNARGHIFAACYPVYSKQNPDEIIGALCIEIDMESTYREIEESNRSAARLAVFAGILSSILTVLAYLWMRRLNKREIEQRRKLDAAYERTAKANRELEQARKDIERAYDELKEETIISGALSKEYSSLFKINAKTGKLSLYRTDGMGMSAQDLEKLMLADDYETVLSGYIDTFVVPEDRDRIRELGSLNILLELVPEIGLHKLGFRREMNGEISYYEMNVAKTVDEAGDVTFILGMRNVDEEMRRQLKQTNKMEMQREIIEGLCSEYYSVLLVNPETDVITTFRAEEEEGRAIKEYFHKHGNCWSKGILEYSRELISEASRSEFIEKLSLEYIRSNQKDYSFTYEKLVEDGSIYLQARVAYVREKDGTPAVVIGTRNVDDLIRRERQQEKALQAALNEAKTANRAKTDFLSRMSHDIRTPLNGILGLLEMDERHPDDRKLIEENRGKIKVAAYHLNSLLNDILQLSKLENGNVELSREVMDINSLASDVVTMVAIEAAERGITFYHGDFSKNLVAPFVYGSPLHLRQIFLNIFSNAIKYNKPGGSISCKAECKSIDEKIVLYECTISDTGIGMSKEFLEHIFEPFSQERSDARSTYQGTGLGMAIVKSLVDKMGGTIQIDSTEGEGSTFTVTIPFEIAAASEAKKTCDEEGEVCIRNLRVLVVEDNELNMEIAQFLLEDAGAVVTKAVDGKQAVDLFSQNPAGTFDAILMDVMMPVMNGIEAAKAIRLMDRSDARTIPIIAMTANAFEEDRQATKNAGMNAHLSKPLNGREVLQTIAKYSRK